MLDKKKISFLSRETKTTILEGKKLQDMICSVINTYQLKRMAIY